MHFPLLFLSLSLCVFVCFFQFGVNVFYTRNAIFPPVNTSYATIPRAYAHKHTKVDRTELAMWLREVEVELQNATTRMNEEEKWEAQAYFYHWNVYAADMNAIETHIHVENRHRIKEVRAK